MEQQQPNFWQSITDAWKTQGQNFISSLPKFIAETGLSLGSNWLAGLIENGLDFNSYRQKADYQFQLSEKMAQNAYSRQLDFWNKQNAYNTPQAMVGRMAQAGLNPAQSITPQPAGNLSNVSTPMPSASSSRPNIAGGLESFGQILYSVKQLGLLDKETELKAKELVSKQLDNDLKTLARAAGFSDAFIKEMDRRAQWQSVFGDDVPIPENPDLKDIFPSTIVRNPRKQEYRAGEQSINTSKAHERLLDAETSLAQANTDLSRNKAATELALAARAWADALLIEAQESFTRTQEGIALNKEQRDADLHATNKALLTAETLLKRAQTNKVISEDDLLKYEKEIAELKSNGAGLDLDRLVRKLNILIHDFAGNIISGFAK